MYTEAEVLNSTLDYFDNDYLATEVFMTKYALKDLEDNYHEKNPDQMHKRLAHELARIEVSKGYTPYYFQGKHSDPYLANDQTIEEPEGANVLIPIYAHQILSEIFYEKLKYFKRILFQGSPCAAIGNPFQIMSSSNCYVIEPPKDSYGGICKADQEIVQLAKRRGGIGLSLNNLRPRDLMVQNAARSTTGIGPFMNRFSNSTGEVGQEGRRGALIMSLLVHHPEIITFLKIKSDHSKVTNANISVEYTDEFMRAVQDDELYEQRWPCEAEHPTVNQLVDAKTIWDEAMRQAWANAEPGALFVDTIKKWTPANLYELFRFVGVNPCGEQILGAYNSCRLLLQNVWGYVLNPFTDKASFNWELFIEDVHAAIRMGDNLVDLELELVSKIIRKVKSDPENDSVKAIELELWENIKHAGEQGRRIGLGITGLGDAIAGLNMRYASDDSIEFVEKLYKTLAIESFKASAILARDRGAFPAYDAELEKEHPYLERLFEASPELRELHAKYGRRNVALVNTPPAGSSSMPAKVTSGLEPLPYIEYDRKRKTKPGETDYDSIDSDGNKFKIYTVVHDKFKLWQQITGKTKVEESPYYKATCRDVDWVKSVELQAAAQKWVDSSISKTCNLPEDATVETVSKCFMKAWEMGCKGFTVYRENSRTGIITPKDQETEVVFESHDATPRPEKLKCVTYTPPLKGQKWFVLVGLLNEKPYEVMAGVLTPELEEILYDPKFCSLNSEYLLKRKFKTVNNKYDLYSGDGEVMIKDVTSYANDKNYGVQTRLISMALRHGVKPVYLVDQLMKTKDSGLYSFNKMIARVLKWFIDDGEKTTLKPKSVNPDCTTPDHCQLNYQEGCISCTMCGFSKCG